MPNAWIESDDDELATEVVNHIQMVYDPEIPLNVYDLGLIYKVVVQKNVVEITMTLTNPGCPSGSEIAEAVKRAIGLIKTVESVQIKITFDPPYSQDMMSEAAKLELGFL